VSIRDVAQHLAGSYPLGRKGPVIGTPYTGTHTIGNWQSDNAVDIKVPVGTPVLAIADGTIGSNIGSLGAAAGSRFAGLRVQLNGSGNSWWYGHLSRLTVKAGQHVKAGDVIGYSGSASGVAHLHLGQEHGDPRTTLGSSVPPQKLTSGLGPLEPAVQGAVDVASGAANPVGMIVGAIAGAIGDEGAKILMWIALVGGGAVLFALGTARLTGLGPRDLAKVVPAGRAAAVVR
jgi:murein DD-endopeptidase MepM/ murein hydrolase activator NlpD